MPLEIGFPGEIGHNNAVRAVVDSNFVRGGIRRVANLAALYALSSVDDPIYGQISEYRTLVWVDSENSFYQLVDITNSGVEAGWTQFSTGSDELVFTIENGELLLNGTSLGTVVGTGEDGVGIASIDNGVAGQFTINLTDSTSYTINLVNGEDGADGSDGASAFDVWLALQLNPDGLTEADFIAAITGADGSDGAPGAPGADGEDGNTIVYSSGAPNAGDGTDGDFYIDIVSKHLYGPKLNGEWPTTYVELIGQDGLPATISNISVNTIAPDGTSSASLVDNGNNDYSFEFNIQRGFAGEDGADGNTVLSGNGAPGAIGVDGDFYIDTTGYFIYGPKVGTSWGDGTSLVGPPGEGGAGELESALTPSVETSMFTFADRVNDLSFEAGTSLEQVIRDIFSPYVTAKADFLTFGYTIDLATGGTQSSIASSLRVLCGQQYEITSFRYRVLQYEQVSSIDAVVDNIVVGSDIDIPTSASYITHTLLTPNESGPNLLPLSKPLRIDTYDVQSPAVAVSSTQRTIITGHKVLVSAYDEPSESFSETIAAEIYNFAPTAYSEISNSINNITVNSFTSSFASGGNYTFILYAKDFNTGPINAINYTNATGTSTIDAFIRCVNSDALESSDQYSFTINNGFIDVDYYIYRSTYPNAFSETQTIYIDF